MKFGHIVGESETGENAEAVSLKQNGKGVANMERLFVPNTEEIAISFTQELYRSDVLVDTKEVTVKSEEIEFKPGHVYNFIIKLSNPGESIQFTVNMVTEWTDEDKEMK